MEVYKAYSELTAAGIVHMDVRRANILKVLQSDDTLPGIPSPIYNHVLRCRIIDLEISRKAVNCQSRLEYIMKYEMNILLHGLPKEYSDWDCHKGPQTQLIEECTEGDKCK